MLFNYPKIMLIDKIQLSEIYEGDFLRHSQVKTTQWYLIISRKKKNVRH